MQRLFQFFEVMVSLRNHKAGILKKKGNRVDDK